MRHAIVIEKAASNYSAYVPDLPGCVATGETIQETETMIREAIEFHMEGLRADSLPIPQPSSQVEYVEVSVSQTSRTFYARVQNDQSHARGEGRSRRPWLRTRHSPLPILIWIVS
jgi:predicted RNase H-like HicB family nuclease